MNDFEKKNDFSGELEGFDSVENKTVPETQAVSEFSSEQSSAPDDIFASAADEPAPYTEPAAHGESDLQSEQTSYDTAGYGEESAVQDFSDAPATDFTQPQSNSFDIPSAPASYTPPTSYSPQQPYGSYIPNGSYGASGSYQAQPTQVTPVVKPPKPPKQKKAKKGFSAGAVVSFALVAAIIGGSAGFGGYIAADKIFGGESGSQSNTSTTSGTNAAVQNININSTVDSVVEAVALKCSPSVVGIRTTALVSNFLGNQESSGEGSGIIYSADGYIITNYHVIESAVQNAGRSSTKIEVFLPSDSTNGISATIVGYNISYDLAVIKIDKTGLPAIEIGNSDELNVGQNVIAIGNPGGLSFMGSVSHGIISGLNRTLSSTNSSSGTSTAEYIQTDAAINPGNSGGALVTEKGQLIGVNSVKLVSTSYEGMGFAIPINKVVEICTDIIEHENEPAPYIGVEISNRYDANTLQMYGFPVGAVISSVTEGGPADAAGLQKGDIITAFNGTELSNYTDLDVLLSQCKSGDTVEIAIYRSGRTYTTTIAIGSNS